MLYSQDGGTHEYVVVFGGYGNTLSDIRRIPDETETVKDQASTPSICDCDSYKSFWVQWLDDGSILAGTGEDVGRIVFHCYNLSDQTESFQHFL